MARDETPVGDRPTGGGRTSRGLLAIATTLGRVTAPLRRRRGLGEAALFSGWSDIIGSALAAECTPSRLVRGPEGVGGTLHVRAAGPLALELQHLEPQVIERINGYFGYRAVGRLKLHQAPMPPPPANRAGAPKPDPRAHAMLERDLEGVRDPALRDALGRLGDGLLRRAARRRATDSD